jgi:hypothetical protein
VTLGAGGILPPWVNSATSARQCRRSSPTRSAAAKAYVVTENGVFHAVQRQLRPPAATISGTQIQNVTGNLLTITHDIFGDTSFQENLLNSLSPNNLLTSLAVDWRWKIPDDLNNPAGPVHPALYVAGNSGVFRALNFNPLNPGGITWEIFPNNRPTTQFGGDGAPVNGGYLPVVYVTDLDLSIGNLDPTTGLPNQPAGPNMLVATTFGRGVFAIRLDNETPFNFVSGPKVVSVGPATSGPGLSFVEVTFDGSVNIDSFDLTDVSILGPNGLVTITDIQGQYAPWASATEQRLPDLRAQNSGGTYTSRSAGYPGLSGPA